MASAALKYELKIIFWFNTRSRCGPFVDKWLKTFPIPKCVVG